MNATRLKTERALSHPGGPPPRPRLEAEVRYWRRRVADLAGIVRDAIRESLPETVEYWQRELADAQGQLACLEALRGGGAPARRVLKRQLEMLGPPA